MGLRIEKSKDGTKVLLTLAGCIGDHENSECGHFERFEWKFNDVSRANVVSRLYLHLLFGRKHVLDTIIQKFDDGWVSNNESKKEWCSKEKKVTLTSPLEVWKYLILESMKEDSSWNTCSTCLESYQAGNRSWDKIIFVAAPEKRCDDHEKGQVWKHIVW